MFIKITNVETALSKISDNSVVAVSGFNMAANPEYLILELYRRYKEQEHPRNLFIIAEALPAIPGRALDKVAQQLHKDPKQSFLRGALIPFLGFSPWLQRLVIDDRIEAYSWPIGVVAYWFREIASGRPGLLTKIGIDTYLDPRREGGALNEGGRKKQTSRVSFLSLEGEDYLLYYTPKPNFALIRATTSDETGNLSMEDEAVKGTVINIAQAVKARPKQGIVISQVRWLTRSGTINPRSVDIPGPLVDYVIVAPKQFHWQSGSVEFDPRFSYRVLPSISELGVGDVLSVAPADHQKVIARRVLLELIKVLEEKGSPVMINLGVGIPAIVSVVAAEEEISEFIVSVFESGQWGGIALTGIDFGVAISPFALSTMPDMFSNFEGGIKPSNKGLKITSDGTSIKFVPRVFKVFFSGNEAQKYQKDVLYVTERAVFRLGKKGLVLEEIAPRVDLEKDILAKMSFTPMLAPKIKTMDNVLFRKGKMNLREDVLAVIKR